MMKCVLTEHVETMLLCIEPETKEEAVRLVRLGMNYLREPTDIEVHLFRDGGVSGYLTFPLKKARRSIIE